MKFPDQVKILRGKYKGRVGLWACYTTPHPLASNKRRSQVRVSGFDARTLLMHDESFEIISYKVL